MPVGKSMTSVGDSEYSLVLSTATMFASNSLAMRTIQFKSSVTCYQWKYGCAYEYQAMYTTFTQTH